MLKQEAVSTTISGVPYTANYNYDAMGNRTTTTNSNSSAATNTYATNALNQVTGITTSYAGKPGPFPSVGFVYDDAGNLTRTNGSDGSYTLFGYDDLDRLIIIDHRDTAGTPTTGTNFYYDYANRLVTTVELSWARVQWQIDSEKLHIYDGMDVVQERDRYNNVSAQLVRDGNIGGILSRTTAEGATFYDYDGNGNVTLLTDTNGQDVGHYRYDAYGNTLEVSGSRAAENPWRFSTKELHGGWYNFGYRFYAPDIGRWINRDPITEDGGVNLYGFVENNPIRKTDAYGLWPKPGDAEYDPYFDPFRGGPAPTGPAYLPAYQPYKCPPKPKNFITFRPGAPYLGPIVPPSFPLPPKNAAIPSGGYPGTYPQVPSPGANNFPYFPNGSPFPAPYNGPVPNGNGGIVFPIMPQPTPYPTRNPNLPPEGYQYGQS